MTMKYKTISIFLITLLGVFVCMAALSRALSGNWSAAVNVADVPIAVIAASMVVMVFVVREYLPHGAARAYSVRGFSVLFLSVLYVLAIEKYSYIFPYETWIFNLHPLEPIFITAAILLILKGRDHSVSESVISRAENGATPPL